MKHTVTTDLNRRFDVSPTDHGVWVDTRELPDGETISSNLTREEALQLRAALDAVLESNTDTETVELEAVLYGGLVDDLARAARGYNLAVSVTLTPLDD